MTTVAEEGSDCLACCKLSILSALTPAGRQSVHAGFVSCFDPPPPAYTPTAKSTNLSPCRKLLPSVLQSSSATATLNPKQPQPPESYFAYTRSYWPTWELACFLVWRTSEVAAGCRQWTAGSSRWSTSGRGCGRTRSRPTGCQKR